MWGSFLTGEGKKWQRHVDLILPLHLTLVILFIQITCRPYDVTFMSLLSVFFDRAVDVNLLSLCQTNRAALFNHHHLFQSSMLIQTGPDLFQKLPRFYPSDVRVLGILFALIFLFNDHFM